MYCPWEGLPSHLPPHRAFLTGRGEGGTLPPQRPTLSRRRPVGYGTLIGRSTRQEPIELHLGGLPKSGFSSKRWPSSPRELRSELQRKMRTKRRLKRCLVALRAQKSMFYRGESKTRFPKPRVFTLRFGSTWAGVRVSAQIVLRPARQPIFGGIGA